MTDDILFVEKYRPKTVKDCILSSAIKQIFENFVKEKKFPNLLLSGTAGTGKTTVAKALCNELDYDYIMINASDERNIDMVRNTIKNFASVVSLTGRDKAIILDECLEENEEVRIGTIDSWFPMKLKDMKIGIDYDLVSFNMITKLSENDSGKIISIKEDFTYIVTLEDGRSIEVTEDHPFIVNCGENCIEKSILDGLNGEDDIVIA